MFSSKNNKNSPIGKNASYQPLSSTKSFRNLSKRTAREKIGKTLFKNVGWESCANEFKLENIRIIKV